MDRRRNTIVMLARFAVGVVKGLLLGAGVGHALALLGYAIAPGFAAYLAVLLLALVVAAVAGKKFWEPAARVQVGLKAVIGLALAPVLYWLARTIFASSIPFELASCMGMPACCAGAPLLRAECQSPMAFAIVGALLAGFFEADDRPDPVARR
ncbi:MAG: hypothetical protein EXR75_02255 [Myxococcales bacterium]|nr:hypothetical protein [Myxococcales bacterium]